MTTDIPHTTRPNDGLMLAISVDVGPTLNRHWETSGNVLGVLELVHSKGGGRGGRVHALTQTLYNMCTDIKCTESQPENTKHRTIQQCWYSVGPPS